MRTISTKACPICGRPADARTKPFCSVRCADVDLGRWLTGSYAIPVAEDEAEPEHKEGELGEDLPGHGRMS